MKSITTLVAIWIVATIAVGAQRTRAERQPWLPPADASVRANPLAHSPTALPGGQKLFRQRCSICHGTDGTGTARGPNLMTRRVQEQTDGALFWKVSSGNTRTGMPSFSYLPEPQRWQLVLALRDAAGR